jgi:hypothetical protein
MALTMPGWVIVFWSSAGASGMEGSMDMACTHGKRRAARSDWSNSSAGETRKYLELQFDAATFRELEKLATKNGCTPFEMSVILLEERLSGVSGACAVSEPPE